LSGHFPVKMLFSGSCYLADCGSSAIGPNVKKEMG
jgi:hypothetical protein